MAIYIVTKMDVLQLSPMGQHREFIVVRLYALTTEKKAIMHDYGQTPDNARPPNIDQNSPDDSLGGIMTILRAIYREITSRHQWYNATFPRDLFNCRPRNHRSSFDSRDVLATEDEVSRQST
jgi:hypothetical protein